MDAYVFHVVMLGSVGLTALYATLGVRFAAVTQRLIGLVPAIVLVVAGSMVLRDQEPYVVVDDSLSLRYQLAGRSSFALVVSHDGPASPEWSTVSREISANPLASADWVRKVADHTQAQGAVLRLDLDGPREVRVRAGASAPIHLAGRLVSPNSVSSLDPGVNVLRWGTADHVLHLVEVENRVLAPFLFAFVLLLAAGWSSARQPWGPVAVSAMNLATMAVLVHARLGTDLAVLRGFRASVAALAAIATVALVRSAAPSRRRLLALLGATVGGLAVAATRRGFVGELAWFNFDGWRPIGITDWLFTWVAGVVVASFLASVTNPEAPSTTRHGRRKLFPARLGRRVPPPRCGWPALGTLALLPIGITLLGGAGLPGRFLLTVAILMAWSRLLETRDFSDFPRPWNIELLKVIGALTWVAALAAIGDFGFGAALGATLLLSLSMLGSRWTWTRTGQVAALAFLLVIALWAFGWLPRTAENRLLGFINPSFGLGADQQLQGRLAIQDGALWGQAWAGPQRLRIPHIDDDFVLAAVSHQFGFLGLVAVIGAFLSWLIAVLRVAWAGKYRGDRDHTRLVAVFAVCLCGFLSILAAFNLGGIVGLLPLTGVPVALVSRSTDVGLCVALALGFMSTMRSGQLQPPRNWRRDLRFIASTVLLVPAALLAFATVRAKDVAMDWLHDPGAVWHSFHEKPTIGPIVELERRIGTNKQTVVMLRAMADGYVALNGQRLSAGSERMLRHDDEIELGSKRLRLVESQWFPELRVSGWVFPSSEAPVSVGRIRYFDGRWAFGNSAPDVALDEDLEANLDAGSFSVAQGSWKFEQAANPYRVARVRFDGESWKPLSGAVDIPSDGRPVRLELGRSVLLVSQRVDGSLNIDLRRLAVSLAVSKDGTTHIGGGAIVHDGAYRSSLHEGRRLQASMRALLEEGVFSSSGNGDIVQAREPKDRILRNALQDIELLRTRRYAESGNEAAADPANRESTIPRSALSFLEDGRAAGFNDTELTRRLRLGTELQRRFQVADAHGQVVDPEELGLITLMGTGSGGPKPGLAVLASAGDSNQSRVSPLSLFYPLALPTQRNTPFMARTTIQVEVQETALQALEQWSAEFRQRAAPYVDGDPRLRHLEATILITDSKNQILAIASTPQPRDEAAFRAVLNAGQPDPAAEVAALLPVLPGSVAKLPVWSFLLENEGEFFFRQSASLFPWTWEPASGNTSSPRPFVDRGVVSGCGPPIQNFGGFAYGRVPFFVHLIKSTNTSLVGPLSHLGAARMTALEAYGATMGFFGRWSLIPLEISDPTGPWEAKLRWRGRNVALEPVAASPHGRVEGGAEHGRQNTLRCRFHLGTASNVTALHILTAVNTIATGGQFFSPRLLTGLGETRFAEPIPVQAMSPAVATRMHAAMRGVVRTTNGYSGTAATVFEGSTLLGETHDLIGKTGTPERERIVTSASGRLRRTTDRADKIFVASFKPHPNAERRLNVLVYGRLAGAGGPGQPPIDAAGALRTARWLMERLSETRHFGPR